MEIWGHYLFPHFFLLLSIPPSLWIIVHLMVSHIFWSYVHFFIFSVPEFPFNFFYNFYLFVDILYLMKHYFHISHWLFMYDFPEFFQYILNSSFKSFSSSFNVFTQGQCLLIAISNVWTLLLNFYWSLIVVVVESRCFEYYNMASL